MNARVFKIKSVFLRLVTCDSFCTLKLSVTKQQKYRLKALLTHLHPSNNSVKKIEIFHVLYRRLRRPLWHNQNVKCLILRQLLTLSKCFFLTQFALKTMQMNTVQICSQFFRICSDFRIDF